MSDIRERVHDSRITIRVSEDIKRRATAAARRQGMNLSEAIRGFLRQLAGEDRGDDTPEIREVSEIVKLIDELFETPTTIRTLSPDEQEDWNRRWEKAVARAKADRDDDN